MNTIHALFESNIKYLLRMLCMEFGTPLQFIRFHYLKIISIKLSIWEDVSASGLTTVQSVEFHLWGLVFSLNKLFKIFFKVCWCCALLCPIGNKRKLFFPDSCYTVKAQLKTFSSNTLSLSPPLSLCGFHSVTWQIPFLSLHPFSLMEIEISTTQSQQILILMCKQRHILFKSYL